MPMPSDNEKKSLIARYSEIRQSHAKAIMIPYIFLAYPIAGLLIGTWIDRRFNTSPWFLLVFLVAGFVEAIREVIRIAKSMESDTDSQDE